MKSLQPEQTDHYFFGGLAMKHSPQWHRRWHSAERARKRGRAPKRRDDADEAAADEAELSPDDLALRAAHEMAERKTELAGDALKWGAISLALLLTIPPVGFVVLLVGVVKFGKEAYELELEPRLRGRFIEQEATKLVHASLSQQRRDLEGAHAKSLETLSASIAHEIRNPITAAKSLVQQMGETPTAKENVEYARVALEELQRVERSVAHLLRFAREEEAGFAVIDMADVLDSALESFRDRAERSGVSIVPQIDCPGTLKGDAEQLRRVIINLVGNAIDALDQAFTKSPMIDVQMGENLAGSEVWVRIRDNGPGIDAETARRLFGEFYSNKPNGTGLGLAICKKIVDAHGGSIEVTSDPGDGAEFLLTFPKRSAEIRGGSGR